MSHLLTRQLSKIFILSTILFQWSADSRGIKPVFPEDPTNPPAQPIKPPAPVIPKPKPEVIHEMRWERHHQDGRDWSVHTYDEVGNRGGNMLSTHPSDIRDFCPNFHSLNDSEKRNFWTYLLSAMVHYESYYKPETKYQEKFNDRFGNPVISRGLLQISIESANGYGCKINNPQELHDPYINLSCGITILNRWVGRDGRLAGKTNGTWKGGARYWAVLRMERTVEPIKQWTRNFCQNTLWE